MRYWFTFVALLTLNNSPIFSQDSLVWKPRLIHNLNEYKTNLLNLKPEHTFDLKQTIYRWKAIEKDTDLILSLLFNIKYAVKYHDYTFVDVITNLENYCPHSKLKDKIAIGDINNIVRNSELVDLINFGVVNLTYPYETDISDNLSAKLNLIKIRNGDKIAEIGAGEGVLSQIISMMGYDISLYVNEIDEKLVKLLEKKRKNNGFGLDSSKVFVIQGKETIINLPQKADKIIIHNSFHHFSKKNKMLNSIGRSMQKNGRLIMMEPLKDQNSKDNCTLKMNEWQIQDLLNKYGFVLENRKLLDSCLLLEYSWKEN